MRIKKQIAKQNFIPKIKAKFWGKVMPICQFTNQKEEDKNELNKSNKNEKI